MAKTKAAGTEKKVRKPRVDATFVVVMNDGSASVCRGKLGLEAILTDHGTKVHDVYKAVKLVVCYETRVRFGAPKAKKTPLESAVEFKAN